MTIKTNREFILNKEWTLLKNAFNKKEPLLAIYIDYDNLEVFIYSIVEEPFGMYNKQKIDYNDLHENLNEHFKIVKNSEILKTVKFLEGSLKTNKIDI